MNTLPGKTRTRLDFQVHYSIISPLLLPPTEAPCGFSHPCNRVEKCACLESFRQPTSGRQPQDELVLQPVRVRHCAANLQASLLVREWGGWRHGVRV